jgi:hypothetical protein
MAKHVINNPGGRKPLPEEEKYGKPIPVRFTQKQFVRIKRKAGEMLHEVFYHTYAVVFYSLTLIFWFVFFLFDFKTSLMENSIDSIKGFTGFVCNNHKPCLMSPLTTYHQKESFLT